MRKNSIGDTPELEPGSREGRPDALPVIREIVSGLFLPVQEIPVVDVASVGNKNTVGEDTETDDHKGPIRIVRDFLTG